MYLLALHCGCSASVPLHISICLPPPPSPLLLLNQPCLCRLGEEAVVCKYFGDLLSAFHFVIHISTHVTVTHMYVLPQWSILYGLFSLSLSDLSLPLHSES